MGTGRVTHELRDSHTGDDFLNFMKKVARQYAKRELHVILDNSSTHGTPDIQAWLAANPNVHFHYTRRVRPGLTRWRGSSASSVSSR